MKMKMRFSFPKVHIVRFTGSSIIPSCRAMGIIHQAHMDIASSIFEVEGMKE